MSFDPQPLDELLDAAVQARAPAPASLPSISLAIVADGQVIHRHAAGLARLQPPRAAHCDSVYDLASLTKALAGATVAASLIQEGRLQIDGRVDRWVPELPRTLRLRHLLDHSAGFSAWEPLYERVGPAHGALWGGPRARERILAAARTASLDCAPGQRHRYSDLGFLVLLQVLERAGGARLDALFAERVLRPAGMEGKLSWGCAGAVATERCPVRGRLIEGEVHDLNAHAMGGVSSHAGLFGSATTVARLAERLGRAARRQESELPGEVLAALWSRPGPGSHRGGWDTISPGYSSTGAHFPSDTVGHLGYTGTSVWMSPSRGVAVALLGNRVHPADARKAELRALRPQVHDAVASCLGWDLGGG